MPQLQEHDQIYSPLDRYYAGYGLFKLGDSSDAGYFYGHGISLDVACVGFSRAGIVVMVYHSENPGWLGLYLFRINTYVVRC